MPTTEHDDDRSVEPPPTQALVDLEAESFRPGPSTKGCDPAQRVADLPEPELLELLAHGGVHRRSALAELYTRHSRYIFKVASRASRTLDHDQVSGAVTDTFLAADRWAQRQPEALGIATRFSGSDPEAGRRKVLGWLSTIARRITVELAVELSRSPAQSLTADIAAPSESSEDAEPPPSTEHRGLSEALSKLTADQLEALRVSLPWYEPATQEFAFPRGEAERVAVTLGITAEVLRQRRHRSLRRLHSLLSTKTPV